MDKQSLSSLRLHGISLHAVVSCIPLIFFSLFCWEVASVLEILSKICHQAIPAGDICSFRYSKHLADQWDFSQGKAISETCLSAFFRGTDKSVALVERKEWTGWKKE